jgi:hypothetical protein
MKHPFYFATCIITCFFHYRANDRGFSFLGKAFALGGGSGGGRSGLYHK